MKTIENSKEKLLTETVMQDDVSVRFATAAVSRAPSEWDTVICIGIGNSTTITLFPNIEELHELKRMCELAIARETQMDNEPMKF